MWFGFDLVDEGLISSADLCAAMRRQMQYRRPIGQLAVEAGYMTIARVFDVLATQHEWHRPFGEVAMELGYLKREQLGLLLLQQNDTIPTLEESLIAAGAITKSALDAWICEYRSRLGGTSCEIPDIIPLSELPVG